MRVYMFISARMFTYLYVYLFVYMHVCIHTEINMYIYMIYSLSFSVSLCTYICITCLYLYMLRTFSSLPHSAEPRVGDGVLGLPVVEAAR